MKAAALALLLALNGCALVRVQSAGAVHLSVWPLGVRVAGDGGALAIDAAGFGIEGGCGESVAGVYASQCIVVSPAACGVAVIKISGAVPGWLNAVSRKTRAACLGK